MRCSPPKEQIVAGTSHAAANLSGKEDSGGKDHGMFFNTPWTAYLPLT